MTEASVMRKRSTVGSCSQLACNIRPPRGVVVSTLKRSNWLRTFAVARVSKTVVSTLPLSSVHRLQAYLTTAVEALPVYCVCFYLIFFRALFAAFETAMSPARVNNVMETIGHNKYVYLWLLTLPGWVAQWCIGGVLTFMAAIRVKSRKYQPDRFQDILPAMPLVVFNWLLGLTFGMTFLYCFLPDRAYAAEMPPFWGRRNSLLSPVPVQLALIGLFEECWYYYFHRLAHEWKWAYKHIHKVHHKHHAPSAWHAFYAHPAEHILLNTFPAVLAPTLLGCHVSTAFIFIFVGYLSAVLAHSGYDLPFWPGSEDHDVHHEKFRYNFGVLGICDRIHGTQLVSKQ